MSIEEGWSVKWKCQVRADQLDEATIEMMSKTGCFEVDIGVESGNPEIQKYIRKNLRFRKDLKHHFPDKQTWNLYEGIFHAWFS